MDEISLEEKSTIRSRRELIQQLEAKHFDQASLIKTILDNDPEDPNEYADAYRNKVVSAGFDMKEVTKAIASEAAYILGNRLGDMHKRSVHHGGSSEQIVIDHVRNLGFDPYDREALVRAHEKLIDLK